MNIKEELYDVSAELAQKYGEHGTPERAKFDEEAYNFYVGQVLHKARKEAGVTQSELASRINSSKSYISRVENGDINPSAGMFYRIITALGMDIVIQKTI